MHRRDKDICQTAGDAGPHAALGRRAEGSTTKDSIPFLLQPSAKKQPLGHVSGTFMHYLHRPPGHAQKHTQDQGGRAKKGGRRAAAHVATYQVFVFPGRLGGQDHRLRQHWRKVVVLPRVTHDGL